MSEEFSPLASATVSDATPSKGALPDTAAAIQAVQQKAAESEGAPPAPEPEKKPEPEKPADDRFAELSRRDSEVREKEQALKRRSEELDAAEARYRRFDETERIAKQDPLAALKHLGIDPDQVVAHHTNAMKPGPEKEVDTLKTEVTELRQVVSQLVGEIKSKEWRGGFTEAFAHDDLAVARSLPDIKKDAEDLAAQNYSETGELLTPEVASRRILDKFKANIAALKDDPKAKQWALELLGVSQAPAAQDNQPRTGPQETNPGPKSLKPDLGNTPVRRLNFLDDEADMQRIVSKYQS